MTGTRTTGRPGTSPGAGSSGVVAGLRTAAAPLAVGAAVATAALVVSVVDPNRPGQYLFCPVLAVAGVACPLCGGLRAVHALSDGDVGAALAFNVVVVLGLPVAAVVWAVWLARRTAGRPGAVLPSRVLAGLAIAVAAFGVVRNLPGAREVLTPWLG